MFRLSLQRALWGMIPSTLRAVAMGWSDDGAGTARFVFEKTPDEEESELMGDIETEVIADFDERATFHFTSEFDLAEKLSLRADENWWAFLRA